MIEKSLLKGHILKKYTLFHVKQTLTLASVVFRNVFTGTTIASADELHLAQPKPLLQLIQETRKSITAATEKEIMQPTQSAPADKEKQTGINHRCGRENLAHLLKQTDAD